MTHEVEVPYGGYWSTPFARWQGSLSHLHSLRFAAQVAQRELASRKIDPSVFDFGVLGMTRPEKGSFYGTPWLMGLIGAGAVGGPTLSQACATGLRTILTATHEIDSGLARCALAVACDRTSNGPHIYYPDPDGPGGTGQSENFIMENMACDPLGGHSMTQTAENVANKFGISTAEQHELVLHREEQYRAALANESAFQRRYISLPFPVPDRSLRKQASTLNGDEGIRFSSPEALAKLKPVIEGGTVTYGGQTHPADGSAAMIIAAPEKARALSRDDRIKIELRSFGMARAPLAFMPEAPIAAARRALEAAGVRLQDLAAIKTHNPFVVNDIALARELQIDALKMNNFGSSLVYGHPNGPTGLRGTIELIEELVQSGGGTGLFAGCAAGDTAMAVVIRVGDRPRT